MRSTGGEAPPGIITEPRTALDAVPADEPRNYADASALYGDLSADAFWVGAGDRVIDFTPWKDGSIHVWPLIFPPPPVSGTGPQVIWNPVTAAGLRPAALFPGPRRGILGARRA
jgi:hypothetical protein